MAKTVQECRDLLLSTLMAGLLEQAAQAHARVGQLEEVVAALEAQLAEYKKTEPITG